LGTREKERIEKHRDALRMPMHLSWASLEMTTERAGYYKESAKGE